MKNSPLSTVDEAIRNVSASFANEEFLRVWKGNMDKGETDNNHHMRLMNLYHSTTSSIAKYPKSEKKMSQGSSSSFPSSIAKKEELCDCRLPVRICTSRTPENLNKKFKVCPNSMKAGKKCKLWEWIDEPVAGNPDLEQELDAVKEDVAYLKKEVQELKKKSHGYRLEISCNIL